MTSTMPLPTTTLLDASGGLWFTEPSSSAHSWQSLDITEVSLRAHSAASEIASEPTTIYAGPIGPRCFEPIAPRARGRGSFVDAPSRRVILFGIGYSDRDQPPFRVS